MTDEQPLNGYLDRMRRNIDALDESITDVRKAPGDEKAADKRARLKLLRDLVELQNQTLVAVKTHLLGRDETGAPVEPADQYEGNDQVEFERLFKNQLSPWHESDLKLECADCHVESEGVTYYTYHGDIQMYADLCGKCHDKRTTKSTGESQDTDDVAEPASKADVMLETAALQIKVLKTFPIDQRIVKLEEFLAQKPTVAPGMEPAYEAYRGVLQKELDDWRSEVKSI